jgi:hypothetical protein
MAIGLSEEHEALRESVSGWAVQLNIIGERMFGLPRDPEPGK